MRDIGTPALSWRRLAVLMQGLPRESRFFQAMHPGSEWGTSEYLLASAVDALAGANWQRAGSKGSRPKPVQRPGAGTNTQHMGKARPLHEVRDLFDRWRTGALHDRPTRRVVTHGG